MHLRNNTRPAPKKNAIYKKMINEQQNNYEYNKLTIPPRIHSKDDLEEIKRNFLYYDRYFRGLVLNDKPFENLLFQIDVELNGEIEIENTQKNGLNQEQIEDRCRKLSAYKQYLADKGSYIGPEIARKLGSILNNYSHYNKKYVKSELIGKEILYGDIKNPKSINISESNIETALKQLIDEKIYICYKTVYERCCANIREQKREQNEIDQIQDICREKLDKIILDDWNGNLVNIKTGTIFDENDRTITDIIEHRNNIYPGIDYYQSPTKNYTKGMIYYKSPYERTSNRNIINRIYEKIPAKEIYTELVYSILNDEITIKEFFYIINSSEKLSPEEIINYISVFVVVFKKEQEKYPNEFNKDIIDKFKNIIEEAEYLKKPLDKKKLIEQGIIIKKTNETILPEEKDIEEAIKYLHENSIYICHQTVYNTCKDIMLDRKFLEENSYFTI